MQVYLGISCLHDRRPGNPGTSCEAGPVPASSGARRPPWCCRDDACPMGRPAGHQPEPWGIRTHVGSRDVSKRPIVWNAREPPCGSRPDHPPRGPRAADPTPFDACGQEGSPGGPADRSWGFRRLVRRTDREGALDASRPAPPNCGRPRTRRFLIGAPGGNRTPDLDVRTVLLYPLSYGGGTLGSLKCAARGAPELRGRHARKSIESPRRRVRSECEDQNHLRLTVVSQEAPI